jgi:hypothetical protein
MTMLASDTRARTPDAPAALVPVMRRLLYVAAALVFLAGIPLFLAPEQTDRYFAWTVDSRMTAVFLGAAYWSAIALEFRAARATYWAEARIAVPAVFVFTSLTLVVSLIHLHKLHIHHALFFQRPIPESARVVAWSWLAIYAFVPVIMAFGWIAQHRHSVSVPRRSGLPRVVRVALFSIAALLLGIGIAMLLEPGWAYRAWPWTLTPITRGAIAAWLIGLGVAAGDAWLIDDKRSLQPLGLTGVVFGLLQAVALARYGDELDWGGISAVVYVAILVALTAVSAWALLPPWRRPSEFDHESLVPVSMGPVDPDTTRSIHRPLRATRSKV